MIDINIPPPFSAFLVRWMMIRGDRVWDDALIFQNIIAFVCRSRQHRGIDQFRYIKIQSQTIDFKTRFWGINPTNSVFESEE